MIVSDESSGMAVFSSDSQFICFSDSRNVASAGMFCARSLGQTPAIRVSLSSQIGGTFKSYGVVPNSRSVYYLYELANGTSFACIAQMDAASSARVLFTSTNGISSFSVSTNGSKKKKKTNELISTFWSSGEYAAVITGSSSPVLSSVNVQTLVVTDLSSELTNHTPTAMLWSDDGQRIALSCNAKGSALASWFATSESNGFVPLLLTLQKKGPNSTTPYLLSQNNGVSVRFAASFFGRTFVMVYRENITEPDAVWSVDVSVPGAPVNRLTPRSSFLPVNGPQIGGLVGVLDRVLIKAEVEARGLPEVWQVLVDFNVL